MAQYQAILINPKTKELVCVESYQKRTIRLSYPGEAPWGNAYWDEEEEYTIGGDDYVRSHSPSAGVPKGKGFGYMLYSGLSLRAYSEVQACYGICSPEDNDGPHSSARSDLADEFWRRAVKIGAAKEANISVETESEETGYIDPDCDMVGDYDCAEVTTSSVEVEYTAKKELYLEVQYLPAAFVADQGIILDNSFSQRPSMESIPLEILVGLNLKNCYDADVVRILLDQIDSSENRQQSLFPEADVAALLSTLPRETQETVIEEDIFPIQLAANGRPRRLTRNEAKIDRFFDKYYGKDIKSLP